MFFCGFPPQSKDWDYSANRYKNADVKNTSLDSITRPERAREEDTLKKHDQKKKKKNRRRRRKKKKEAEDDERQAGKEGRRRRKSAWEQNGNFP